jgi:hypothetical protein
MSRMLITLPNLSVYLNSSHEDIKEALGGKKKKPTEIETDDEDDSQLLCYVEIKALVIASVAHPAEFFLWNIY